MDGLPRYEDNLVDALKAILENDELEGAAEGIAKKIISDRGLKGLSEKQLGVFNNFIEPKLKMHCENYDCSNLIDISDIAAAYEMSDEYGKLLCGECQYIESSIANQCAKDD